MFVFVAFRIFKFWFHYFYILGLHWAFGKHKLGSSTISKTGKTAFNAEFVTVANTLPRLKTPNWNIDIIFIFSLRLSWSKKVKTSIDWFLRWFLREKRKRIVKICEKESWNLVGSGHLGEENWFFFIKLSKKDFRSFRKV